MAWVRKEALYDTVKLGCFISVYDIHLKSSHSFQSGVLLKILNFLLF